MKVLRIYVWNVLVKTQGSDWSCIIYCEKSAELLGPVVFTAAPQNGCWHLLLCSPTVAAVAQRLAAEGCGVMHVRGAWGPLCAQQLWHRNEHLGVCQSFEGAHGPLSRCAGVGQGVHAHIPKGLPCLSLPSLPHCSPEKLSSTVCSPSRIWGQLSLEKGRMYDFDTLFVFLLSAIPKSVIKSFVLLAINFIQFSDSQMFCLGQVCCWFTRSTTLLFQAFSPLLVCNSSLRHTFIWKGSRGANYFTWSKK